MLLDEEEYDDLTNAKLQEYITGEAVLKPSISNDLNYQPVNHELVSQKFLPPSNSLFGGGGGGGGGFPCHPWSPLNTATAAPPS